MPSFEQWLSLKGGPEGQFCHLMAPFTARSSLAAFTGQCLSVSQRHRPAIGSCGFPAQGVILKSVDRHSWGARGLRASFASGLRQRIASGAVNFVKRVPSLLAAGTVQLVKLETTVLSPTLLVAIPALLTVWALLEMGYWRLMCQPKRGKVPFVLLRHFVWTCLPLFALSVGWQTRGQGGVALALELVLRVAAAWCLWQWPEQQEAIDQQSSLPLRYSTRVWRALLSLLPLAALGLRLPLLFLSGGAQLLAQPLLSSALVPHLPRVLSQPWRPLLLHLWLSVYGLYFLLVYLPRAPLLEDHLTTPALFSLPRREPAHWGQQKWWHMARAARGSRTEQEMVNQLLFERSWPDGGPPEMLSTLCQLLRPRSQFVEQEGDTWRRAQREARAERGMWEERERVQQAVMLRLRRQALQRTLEGGDAKERDGLKGYLSIRLRKPPGGRFEWEGCEEEEEEWEREREEERQAVLVEFAQRSANMIAAIRGKVVEPPVAENQWAEPSAAEQDRARDRAKAKRLQEAEARVQLTKHIAVLLGRRAEVDDLPWLDYVATHEPDEVLHMLRVRFWIEAEKAAAKEAERDEGILGRDLLARLRFGGPFQRYGGPSAGGWVGGNGRKFIRIGRPPSGMDLPAGLAYGGKGVGGAVWDFGQTWSDDEEEDEEEEEEERGNDAEGELFKGLFRQARRGEAVVVNLEDGVVVRMSEHAAAKTEELALEAQKFDELYPIPDHLNDGTEKAVVKWRKRMREWLEYREEQGEDFIGRYTFHDVVVTLGDKGMRKEEKGRVVGKEPTSRSSGSGKKKDARNKVVAEDDFKLAPLPAALARNGTAAADPNGEQRPPEKQRQYMRSHLRSLVKTRLFNSVMEERQAEISSKNIPLEYLTMKTESVWSQALKDKTVGLTLFEAAALMMGNATPAEFNLTAIKQEVIDQVEWDGDEKGLYSVFRRKAKRREVDAAYRKALRTVAAEMMPDYTEWLRGEEMEGRDFMYEYREAKGDKWQRTWKPNVDDEEEGEWEEEEEEWDGEEEEEEEGGWDGEEEEEEEEEEDTEGETV